MADPRIVTEKRGHIFLIGLDRAKKLNAFDRQMLIELSQAFTTYEEDDALWCAVVYSTSPNFTSGLDLADVGPAIAQGENLYPPGMIDPFGLFGQKRTKPLIHAARGWCLTVGTEMALASDICIASPDARYGQIEVKRGIMPFGGATLRLQQIAGWGNAMRYLLTGDIFDAQEAYRIGLVQEIVPSTDAGDALFDRALALAERVAAQAPLAVQATLLNARQTRDESVEIAIQNLMTEARKLMTTEDAAEGMRSFMERRDGDFQGR